MSDEANGRSRFDAVSPVVCLPIAQRHGTSLNFVMRGRQGGAVPETTIQRIGALVDRRVPMQTNLVSTLIDEQLRPQRIATSWIGVVGAIAPLLAAIGLYGVVAQAVLQRTCGIAVRSALR